MGHYGSWLPLTTLFSGHRCCDFSYRINTIQDQNTIQDTGPRSSWYRKPLPNRWKLSNGHARNRTPILTAAFTKPSFNFHTTSGPVHTQKCVFKSMRRVFVVIENASIDSRPRFRFDAFSTVRAKTLENDRVVPFIVDRARPLKIVVKRRHRVICLHYSSKTCIVASFITSHSRPNLRKETKFFGNW